MKAYEFGSKEHLRALDEIAKAWPTCDGCGRHRRDVKSCGRDSNGDPDAPDLCFLCRKEGERGRVYDRETGKYLRVEQIEQRRIEREEKALAEQEHSTA